MSRVDDEIDNKREAERLLRQQIDLERSAKRRAGEASAFDLRMRESSAQQATHAVVAQERAKKGEDERKRDPRPMDVVAAAKEQARQSQGKAAVQVRARQAGEERRAGHEQVERETHDAQDRRGQDASQRVSQRSGSEKSDNQRVERSNEGRQAGDQLQHGRVESQSEQSDRTEGAQTGEGDAPVGRQGDEGHSKGGGGEKGSGGNHDAPPSFRMHPALLPPTPIARPIDNARTERLRQLANEIAQKIVARARVGHNAAGHAEFQMELHSNVLSGLHIKVSSNAGRIAALFSGNDRKVLAMLRENAQTLRDALQARGLNLVELKVEAQG